MPDGIHPHRVNYRVCTGCNALRWINSREHGFSQCGTRGTTGMPSIVYRYAALIKENRNMQKG